MSGPAITIASVKPTSWQWLPIFLIGLRSSHHNGVGEANILAMIANLLNRIRKQSSLVASREVKTSVSDPYSLNPDPGRSSLLLNMDPIQSGSEPKFIFGSKTGISLLKPPKKRSDSANMKFLNFSLF
jgi:hypothetical protein